MKLRYKINLIAVGYCCCGALLMALCGRLGRAMLLAFLAWFNWTVALASEASESKEEDQ